MLYLLHRLLLLSLLISSASPFVNNLFIYSPLPSSVFRLYYSYSPHFSTVLSLIYFFFFISLPLSYPHSPLIFLLSFAPSIIFSHLFPFPLPLSSRLLSYSPFPLFFSLFSLFFFGFLFSIHPILSSLPVSLPVH